MPKLINYEKYYEIYVNKTNDLTPSNFLGIIKVLGDEKDDNIIDIWCNRKLGPVSMPYNKNIIERWRYKEIYNINGSEHRVINTLKRGESNES